MLHLPKGALGQIRGQFSQVFLVDFVYISLKPEPCTIKVLILRSIHGTHGGVVVLICRRFVRAVNVVLGLHLALVFRGSEDLTCDTTPAITILAPLSVVTGRGLGEVELAAHTAFAAHSREILDPLSGSYGGTLADPFES